MALVVERDAAWITQEVDGTTRYRSATQGECAREIQQLRDVVDLRDAATRSLCIAVHGREIEGKSIYDLIYDVARAMTASQ